MNIPALHSRINNSRDVPERDPQQRTRIEKAILSGGHLRDSVKCRFARDDLQYFEVLGQVDRKFIACVSRSVGTDREFASSLLLVDQHAADERVRVERFLKELASGFLFSSTPDLAVPRTCLPEPAPILLSPTEFRCVCSHEGFRDLLSRWGFDIELPRPASRLVSEGVEDADQIHVVSVPQLLSRKVGRLATGVLYL